MFVRSFDTKSAPRISRKHSNLESTNFIGTSIPKFYVAVPDMASLSTSDRKLYGKNRGKYRLRRLRVEFLENGSS